MSRSDGGRRDIPPTAHALALRPGAARAFVTIVAGNEGSVAVARRAGFTYEGTMRAHSVWQGERCDVMRFAALPHEWTRWNGSPG